MRVDPAKPFEIIFSLNPESEIGPVFEPYAVQLNNGQLSLTYQKLYAHTMKPFSAQIDEAAKEMIRISSEYSLETITRKFSKKEARPHEFLSKHLDEELFNDAIRPYVEDRLERCMPYIRQKPLYMRGKTGNPAHVLLEQEQQEVSVHFHFKRDEEGTTYYTTFRCGEERVTFLNRDVLLIINKPCVLLADNTVYRIENDIDGKKITPFFTKWNINIPQRSEPQYYKKFIASLIEKHTVIPEGFRIYTLKEAPVPYLKLEQNWNGNFQLTLYYDYQKDRIPASETKQVHVKLEKKDENYTYYKLTRQTVAEQHIIQTLNESGLTSQTGAAWLPDSLEAEEATIQKLVQWVNNNRDQLNKKGFKIFTSDVTEKYYLGEIKLDFKVEEKNDWFDVYAMVQFGNYKIPFIKLKKFILAEIHEFQLPDGKIAIIPQEWFSKYKDVLSLSAGNDEEKIRIGKHHYTFLSEFGINTGSKDFSKAFSVSELPEVAPPGEFSNILRPYQVEGFRWMSFLRSNNFGGCLADDMGLGKTIQTLALLRSVIEGKGVNGTASHEAYGQLNLFEASTPQPIQPIEKPSATKKTPTLIIMPTSLVHNWQYEVKKWIPVLNVVVYTGLDRSDKIKEFSKADIILTTYGTARNDIEILKKFKFNYVILDESQVIKNPLSKVSKTVKLLQSNHRLALTGTPIENSLTDLWSQMSFLNPGLLGSYQFFKNNYVTPIEKKNDEDRKQKLRTLIQPFILRRSKEQVAKDLPELTEKLYFSQMTEKQKTLYEQIRNFYRKKLLENLDDWNPSKAQFFVLRGLMQLRLVANHPKMHLPNYEGDSGKFDDITSTLESILSENHKVLVFSQFVRHLDLLAAWLKKEQHEFSLLTGQTKNREQVINRFKNSDKVRVFLISLKAGGVGLNLTEADYVLMCDPWWNPAAEQQAINRAHRIGQDKKVFTYKFISKNTVEEKILLLQEKKLKLSADLIDSRQGLDKNLSKEDIDLLFS